MGRRRLTGLSERQVQVLASLAEGLEVPEIADRLGISQQTVKNHKYLMMRKLDARTSAHLIAIAFRAGLLTAA